MSNDTLLHGARTLHTSSDDVPQLGTKNVVVSHLALQSWEMKA